jgi:hypothetical protein
MLGRYCACEILIANPIDWLYAACLEYFIFFSIDSSEARTQYDENCLSIMQTITYAQKLNIYKLYWYFQQSQCLNRRKICSTQHT